MPSGPSPPPIKALFQSMVHASALYSVVLISQRFAGMILLPLCTRFLTPSEYGILELLDLTAGVVAMLAGANLASALGYFYFERESPEWRNTAASTTMFGAAIIGLLALAAGWLISGELNRRMLGSPSGTLLLRTMFVANGLGIFLDSQMQWLRVENRPRVFAVAALFRLSLQVVLMALMLAVFRLGLLGVVVSNLAAVALAATATTWYALGSLPPRFNLSLFFRMLRFSVPLGLGSMALFVIHFGDRFILRSYGTLADVGLYGLGYKLGMLLALVHGTFHNYWSAQVYAIVRRDDAQSVFARTFTYMVLVLSCCGIGIVVFARPALQILTPPAFHGAATLVPVIVGAYFVRAIGDFFRCLFIVKEKPVFDMVCNWFGCALCLVSYFVLIPRFLGLGAALATLITFLAVGIMAVAWTRRLWPFRAEGLRLLKIGAASAVVLGLYALSPATASLWARIGFAAVLMLFYPLMLWITRFPTQSEYAHTRVAIAAVWRRIQQER